MRKGLFFIVAVLSLVLPLRSGAQGTDAALRPLPLQAAANVLGIWGGAVSPDGSWIVYIVADPSRQEPTAYTGEEFTNAGFSMSSAGGLSLRAVELSSGRTVDVSGEKGSSWSPVWSPDGRYVAFYSDRTGKSTLWVWDRTTEKSRQASTAIVHPFFRSEQPVWTPDSTMILSKFIPSGMTLAQTLALNPDYPKPKAKAATSNANRASVTVYTFTPSATPAPSASAKPAALVPDTSQMAYADARFLSDLALVDVQTGNLRRIAQHVRPAWYAISPDGRSVAYMQMDGWMANAEGLFYDLKVISLASDSQRTLVTRMLGEYGTNQSWSPDSTHIAYIPLGSLADNSVYTMRVADGSTRKLTGAVHPAIDGKTAGELPLWDASGHWIYIVDRITNNIVKIAADGSGSSEFSVPNAAASGILPDANGREYWTPDGGRTALVEGQSAASHATIFCRLDLQSGKCIASLNDPSKNPDFFGITAYSNSAGTFAYWSTDASDPGNLWLTDADFSHPRRISDANPAIREAKLGTTEVIDFTSLSGEHLHAAVMLPANYESGKRYPLVVRQYGGDTGSNFVNDFGFGSGEFNMQVLASRGYAVIYPDIPIHTDKHAPLQDIYDAVMPAVDKVITMGIADPNNLTVMGQSFGGYSAIGLITMTTRFTKAVATSAAPTNLFEAYAEFDHGTGGNTSYYETGQGDMGCTPWECRDRYLQNSPFFFLDKVRTPLLMERGADDDISIQEGEIFVGLRRLGQPVQLLEYANEQHVLEQPINVIDFWNRTLKFLDN